MSNENIAAYENAAYPTVTTAAGALDAIIEDGTVSVGLSDHIADTDGAHAASAISSVDPEAGVLDGVTDVQAALDALADAVDTLVAQLGTADFSTLAHLDSGSDDTEAIILALAGENVVVDDA